MILPDVNLLVYAVDRSSRFHESANRWWNDCVSSSESVSLCYPSVLGFLRLVTNRRVFEHPLAIELATDIVHSWIGQPNVNIVVPTPRHWGVLRSLLGEIGAGADMTTDAHIAALAIEHGCTVYSNDRDFGRFSSLKWNNPLT